MRLMQTKQEVSMHKIVDFFSTKHKSNSVHHNKYAKTEIG